MDESAAAEMRTATAGAAAELTIGHEVDLAVDLAKAYFFDLDTGAAVAAVPAAAAPALAGR
jgi:hypothetical protein